jgi:hypothetical protein
VSETFAGHVGGCTCADMTKPEGACAEANCPKCVHPKALHQEGACMVTGCDCEEA